MMVAILFSGFDFVNDFVQGIVERIFGGSGSIDNVSGNIWVFASGIAYWVYMTGLFITISLMLAFILPFLVVVKNYLLVGISLCIMSFVGASGWENFQFYTNFLISSVLIGVPLYALFFVLTKW